ncbi:hypothetical protein MTP99_018655 [Tenebrio molitor]|jgi:hypothetical protein|nr:hypothetical protein MTP99_018655 [Tenebrio molitor]
MSFKINFVALSDNMLACSQFVNLLRTVDYGNDIFGQSNHAASDHILSVQILDEPLEVETQANVTRGAKLKNAEIQ